MTKPSLPQGTRDFGPETVRKRNFIFNTIRNVFELYGFQPLETPAMENIETLMGKYGDEGDKLIFKILNNGLDNPAKEKQIREDFEKILDGKNNKGITERALKYDLTIPFARFVAMNHTQLTFPFKRYQIQPVWRADRPQKGRYREFYQCDADVVGSNGLMSEVELIQIIYEVYQRLGIPVTIIINNRKILNGIFQKCKIPLEKLNDVLTAIDQFDKIGINNSLLNLLSKGLVQKQIDDLKSILIELATSETPEVLLNNLENKFGNDTKVGVDGIKETKDIFNLLLSINKERLVFFNPKNNPKIYTPSEIKLDFNPYIKLKKGDLNIHFDLTLARGLNYYTASIFEIKANVGSLKSSIGGGGRYDDLTGLFGVPGIPGVGISFGVDRIYDVMEELKLFPAAIHTGTQVLFFNLGNEESKSAFILMQHLRTKGVRCELYHEAVKFDKQFKYAEKKNISFAILIGSKELENKTCSVKDLRNGNQQEMSWDDLLTNFSFL